MMDSTAMSQKPEHLCTFVLDEIKYSTYSKTMQKTERI